MRRSAGRPGGPRPARSCSRRRPRGSFCSRRRRSFFVLPILAVCILRGFDSGIVVVVGDVVVAKLVSSERDDGWLGRFGVTVGAVLQCK